jgi:antitoxin VapB
VVRAKTFKSGNSVALRLPKALGIEAGREMSVREERGRYIVEPVEGGRRNLDVDKFWGKATGLKLPATRGFEKRPSGRVRQPSR